MKVSRLIVAVMAVLVIMISGCITIEDQPSNCTAPAKSSLGLVVPQDNISDSSQTPLGPVDSDDQETNDTSKASSGSKQSSSSKPQSISESNPTLVDDNGQVPAAAAEPQPANPVNPLLSRPGYRPPPRQAVSQEDSEPVQAPTQSTGAPRASSPINISSGSRTDPFYSPTTTAVVVSPSQYGGQQAQAVPSAQPQTSAAQSTSQASASSQVAPSQYSPTRPASSVTPKATASFTSLKGQSNDPFARAEIFVYPVKRAKEGQKISFPDLNATDPDGDILTYYFEPPLDENGEWQTQRGDAGRYYSNISVSDGKNITVQTVILIVEPLNRPPYISVIRPIIVQEGQEVRISPKVSDPDNDTVKITYSGWRDSFPYKTTYDDAGEHRVLVTADDGWNTASYMVNITIKNLNRIPVIEPVKNLTVTEGDLVEISPYASDADGERVSFKYSAPLDPDGKWQTKRGDLGSYKFTVTASDGQDAVSSSAYIKILKAHDPPTIVARDLTVKEGQTATAQVTASSPDKLNLTITYSGWMEGPVKEVGYDEQGEHKVTVAASDGISKATAEFSVTVIDVNRPPMFTPESFE